MKSFCGKENEQRWIQENEKTIQKYNGEEVIVWRTEETGACTLRVRYSTFNADGSINEPKWSANIFEDDVGEEFIRVRDVEIYCKL